MNQIISNRICYRALRYRFGLASKLQKIFRTTVGLVNWLHMAIL
jgi:hypothetical protein